MIKKILDIIYPQICGICGNINKNSLCKECKELMKRKMNKNKVNKDLFYLFDYDGIIREKIIEYKFNDKSFIYKTFAKIIMESRVAVDFIKQFDIVIPVPISRKRKNERGYNQSELIVKELVSLINNTNNDKKHIILFKKNLLIKIKDNKKQSVLTKKERIENVKGVYILNKKYNLKGLEEKRILIFDDIYTTGSTLMECKKAILEQKKCMISFFTIAKD